MPSEPLSPSSSLDITADPEESGHEVDVEVGVEVGVCVRGKKTSNPPTQS